MFTFTSDNKKNNGLSRFGGKQTGNLFNNLQ